MGRMRDIGYYLGMEPLGAVAIVLSTTMLYAAFAFILAHVGQQLYAVPSSLEFAVVTILGAIVGRAILGQVPTLSGGLLRRGLDDSTLWSALRRAGVGDPSQVALAILERDGHISVIREARPCTRRSSPACGTPRSCVLSSVRSRGRSRPARPDGQGWRARSSRCTGARPTCRPTASS